MLSISYDESYSTTKYRVVYSNTVGPGELGDRNLGTTYSSLYNLNFNVTSTGFTLSMNGAYVPFYYLVSGS